MGSMAGGGMGSGGMGGMGGLGGVDLSNPMISSIIQTMLNWGSPILPRLYLNRTENLTPTLKVPGARRTRYFWGPLNIDTVAVCSLLT
jgi:hypothetical protein